MLCCLTIRCLVARHTDDGDVRYSSVRQLCQRTVGTRYAWTDPFNSGSFLSRTALQRSVKSQQAEKIRSTSSHPPRRHGALKSIAHSWLGRISRGARARSRTRCLRFLRRTASRSSKYSR